MKSFVISVAAMAGSFLLLAASVAYAAQCASGVAAPDSAFSSRCVGIGSCF